MSKRVWAKGIKGLTPVTIIPTPPQVPPPYIIPTAKIPKRTKMSLEAPPGVTLTQLVKPSRSQPVPVPPPKQKVKATSIKRAPTTTTTTGTTRVYDPNAYKRSVGARERIALVFPATAKQMYAQSAYETGLSKREISILYRKNKRKEKEAAKGNA